MAKSSEQISKYNTSGGKTDSNLANDALHLGGIKAENFATQKYVQDYHGAKEELLKEYIDNQDALKLQQAKSYTDIAIESQDFSNFAELKDVEALDDKLSNELSQGLNTQKNYTDEKVGALARDVNENFEDVGQSISSLNRTTQELFTSVSNGKSNVAAAITDQGVETASNASFDTMATNIRKIPTGGGEPDPYYVNTGDGTAEANDIMLGKTAYVKGEKIYGSHVDTGVDTSDATATPYDILSGKTAYVDGQKITGILDLSGEKPTYGGDDGVEKIYGGGYGDYSINTLTNFNSNDSIPCLLYNSNTLEIIALVRHNSNNLYFEYLYNNARANTQQTDISSIINTSKTHLINYDDYNSETEMEVHIIGAAALNSSNPYIALLCGHINKKEIELVICPLQEVHTPQNGASVITWEIDFTNLIYHTIERNYTNAYIGSMSSNYACVSEIGDRIIIFNGNVGAVIKIDIDNLSILNDYDIGITGNQYVIDRIHRVSTEKVIIYDTTYNNTGSLTNVTRVLLLDDSYHIQNNILLSTATHHIDNFRFTDNLQYCIAFDGTVYIVSIDWVNFNINLTKINKPTVYIENYRKNRSSFDLIGNKFILTTNSNNKNYVFNFDPTGDTLITLINEFEYDFDVYSNTYTKIGNNLVLSRVSNSIVRTMKMKKDFGELVALKYNGEYFYKQAGGILTAGQPDVRAGKSFIGWMGYPEVGTMQESEE